MGIATMEFLYIRIPICKMSLLKILIIKFIGVLME